MTRIKGNFVSLLVVMSCETELFGSYADIEDVDDLNLKLCFKNNDIKYC